jgi:hypothetical protein
MQCKAIYGDWGYSRLIKVTGALCEDGVRRTATVTGEADTFFSVPARVSAKGKTVSGFLSRDGDDWKFTAYSYRKNAAAVGG